MGTNNKVEMKVTKPESDKPSYEDVVKENESLKNACAQLYNERQVVNRIGLIMEICKSDNINREIRSKAEDELMNVLWPENEKSE